MAMSFAALVKAFDAAVAIGDVARRVRGSGGSGVTAPPAGPDAPLDRRDGPGTFSERLEARLSNVVVAALKEAFDRDHARLELEREHLEEQRLRAEAARRLELRRLAVDRELTRLRWVGLAALGAWVAAVLVLGLQAADATGAARVLLGLSWVALIGAVATAFFGQQRLSGGGDDDADAPVDSGPAGRAALWLLVTGLALSAASLLA